MSRIRLQNLDGLRTLTSHDLGGTDGGFVPRSPASWNLYRALLSQFGAMKKVNTTLGRVNNGLWRPTTPARKPACTGLVAWNGRVGFCE